MTEPAPLFEKMRQLATTHSRGDELRAQADAFENAVNGYWGGIERTVTAHAFLGAWSRARKLWCECSGESLV